MADPVSVAALLASFALFVSCVEGHPVTRFGTATLIGASRTPDAPTVVVYNPNEIVAIPHAEYAKHRRAYDRALANGSLKRRTGADWAKQETDRAKSKAEARQKKTEAKAQAATAEKTADAAEASASESGAADAAPASDTV